MFGAIIFIYLFLVFVFFAYDDSDKYDVFLKRRMTKKEFRKKKIKENVMPFVKPFILVGLLIYGVLLFLEWIVKLIGWYPKYLLWLMKKKEIHYRAEVVSLEKRKSRKPLEFGNVYHYVKVRSFPDKLEVPGIGVLPITAEHINLVLCPKYVSKTYLKVGDVLDIGVVCRNPRWATKQDLFIAGVHKKGSLAS